MIRSLWLVAGFVSLGLGSAGIFLPLLPTVPFLLLAAFCFARGSERVHAWLLSHRVFGPPINDWQERGAIGTRAKWAATVSIIAAFALSIIFGVRPAVLGVQAIVLSAVTLFIWTRPNF